MGTAAMAEAVVEVSAAVGRAIDPMVPRPFRLRRIRKETADTYTLDLEPADGGDLPLFSPGQFNMLYLFGTGECAI